MYKINLSIVIPAYNRSHTIGRTLDSFIAQSYHDWQILVVDDHSTDSTKNVVQSYISKDNRISYMVNERKKGAMGARNTGIIHAQSEWICLFDSDDYAYPTFMEEMMRFATDDYDVVTCDVNAVKLDGSGSQRTNWGGEGNIERALMTKEVYVNNNNSVIRKSKLFEIGLLDEDCKAYQEFDTHLRLSRVCRYKRIDKVLLDWYIGGADTITSKEMLNRSARCYVVWHNRKRWREVSYRSLIEEAKGLWVRTPWQYKLLLIKAAPEVVLLLPIVYLNVIIRKFNKKFNLDIPIL